MKNLSLLLITILCFSCSPSINQLREMDYVANLKKQTLQIPLQSIDEDVALLKSYGQDKKAERLTRQTTRKNEKLRAAINQSFTFSKYEFVTQNELRLDHPWLEIAEKTVHDDKQDREHLQFKIIQNGETKASFDYDGNWGSLPFAIKQFDKRLYRRYTKAQERKYAP